MEVINQGAWWSGAAEKSSVLRTKMQKCCRVQLGPGSGQGSGTRLRPLEAGNEVQSRAQVSSRFGP